MYTGLLLYSGGLTVTLFATGDGTITDLEDETGATTGLWASIDDDPDTPTDTDWVNNVNELSGGDASGFFDITNMPGDWGNAEGGSIVVRVAGNDVAATHKLYVRLYKSDETTTISDEVELLSVSSPSGQTNYAGTITGVSATATKAEWNAARIRLRWSAT